MLQHRVTESERNRITELNQEQSPFLRLLPELRNKIYRYYCASATINVEVPRYSSDLIPHRCRLWGTLVNVESGLSHTCRQIHLESREFRDTPQYLTINSRESFSVSMTSLNLYRRYLIKVCELEITTHMAKDIIGHLCHNFPYDRDPNNYKVFPALEVVVWPIPVSRWRYVHPSETREQQREAAVRYCFVNPTVRTVLAPLQTWY